MFVVKTTILQKPISYHENIPILYCEKIPISYCENIPISYSTIKSVHVVAMKRHNQFTEKILFYLAIRVMYLNYTNIPHYNVVYLFLINQLVSLKHIQK